MSHGALPGHAGLTIVGFFVYAPEAALLTSTTQLCRILLSLRSCEILSGVQTPNMPTSSVRPEGSPTHCSAPAKHLCPALKSTAVNSNQCRSFDTFMLLEVHVECIAQHFTSSGMVP